MNIDYAKWFEEFWEYDRRRSYVKINNPKDRYNRVKKALSRCTCIDDIEKYVCSLNTQKESTRLMMLRFFDYINEKKGTNISSEELSQPIIDGRLERRLEIAKYLHKPHSEEEIEAHFRISKRTCQEDLRALNEGIKAFGSNVRLNITNNKHGQKECAVTMHPIFLPLNLTEVHALTVYLPEVLKRHGASREIIMNIIDRIKLQLSDYACEKLRLTKPYDTSNDYCSDDIMARQRKYVIDYLAKSENTCRFTWEGEEYTGQIRHVSTGYAFCLKDGRILDIDPAEIDFTVDLKYR